MKVQLLKSSQGFTLIARVQAVFQFLLTGVALMQYFCIVDVLQHFPTLIYIRILYFSNPNCGSVIPIGYAVSELPDHAMVLINNEPETTLRMLFVNAIYFPASIIWMAVSALVIHGASRSDTYSFNRWPWIMITLIMFIIDVVTTMWFITDTFNTKTISDLVSTAGGVLSGASGNNPSTISAAWLISAAYGRFLVILFINLALMISVLTKNGANKDSFSDTESAMPSSVGSESPEMPQIPRVSILRRFPDILNSARNHPMIRRTSTFKNATRTFFTGRLKKSPPTDPPPEKKSTVNFPETLLSLPQRLESMIAEQHRRLETATVDTSGRRSPGESVHCGHLDETPGNTDAFDTHAPTVHIDSKGRRNTAVELQGQLPWSYIPPGSHRMRDQLPEDEDLPPVPLPDYTLHPKYRKASVHRAGSNASIMFHKKEERNQRASASQNQQIMQADVLY